MKSLGLTTAALAAILATLSAASPVDGTAIEARDVESTFANVFSNDLRDGACKDFTFVFARGSTEPGYMGLLVGPAVCDAIKTVFPGRVACQGVGPKYTGGLFDNQLPKGTTDVAIQEATDLFTLASTKCPNTKVFASGYSQGAAVIHGSIPSLPAAIKNQIAAVVNFGDTRTAVDEGRIPDYPTDRTKLICAPLDPICTDLGLKRRSSEVSISKRVITHFTYGLYAQEAAEWLATKV